MPEIRPLPSRVVTEVGHVSLLAFVRMRVAFSVIRVAELSDAGLVFVLVVLVFCALVGEEGVLVGLSDDSVARESVFSPDGSAASTAVIAAVERKTAKATDREMRRLREVITGTGWIDRTK